ncbi:hypothetical protein [Nevskia ramosa]|uniref:hypothetical protein n=1 Tax=Nevskia ramosa TaxID=64002 RepID=UPI003D0D3316
MKVTAEKIEVLTIKDADRLDPITVIVQQGRERSGRLIIECWGLSWATYFGSLPEGMSLGRFVVNADADYIANRLQRPNDRKHDAAYLRNIVTAVQAALSERVQAS